MDFGEFLQNYLPPETVALIVSMITAIFTVIKMAITISKQAKVQVESAKEIASACKQQAEDTAHDIMENTLKPYIDELKVVKGSLQAFSKIFVLMQENTPEARLAILKLVEELGTVEVKEIEETKQVILEQVKVEDTKKEEKLEKLEEISKGRI